MKAMILAAGKGERMLPLTRHTPKPLLTVANKPLIQYQLESLAAAGVHDIVINTGPMGEKIREVLGDGSNFGVYISYSNEGPEPLGTGGGVQKALPLLGAAPFILVNGDIWTDLDFTHLQLKDEKLAHILLVDNPGHHPGGDFALHQGCVYESGEPMLTYSGIGLYRPDLFDAGNTPMHSYIPVLRRAIRQTRVSGEHFQGRWFDIGTPTRLQDLEAGLN